jgi:hypothetical protein
MSNVTAVKAKYMAPLGADTTNVAANQTTTLTTDIVLAATAAGFGNWNNVATTLKFTSGSATTNAIVFTITGTDENGLAVTATHTGPAGNANNDTTQVFTSVTQISKPTTATSLSIGTNASNSGPIFSGRTRVRGMHVHSSTNAVSLIIRDSSITGVVGLQLGIPGGVTNQTDPYIPDNGILFPNGAYTDVTGLGSATFFFDG